MAQYLPPTENVPIFDTSLFNQSDEALTYNSAIKKFLTYPTAQGTETFGDINVLGSIQLEDGTKQSSAYTGASALAGAYTTTNMTLDSNGRITAISSGNPIPSSIVVSSTSTSSPLYPVLTNASGVSQTLSVDDIAPTMTYVPSTGTLSTVILNASTSVNYPDSTVQTSAFTGAGLLSGSYTNTNVTINNQGKITAIANGTGGGGGGTNAITADISTTDANSTLYPVLAGVGTTQTLYADNITTPLSYVPFTGLLSTKTMTTTNDINVNGVKIGSNGLVQTTILGAGNAGNTSVSTGGYNTMIGNASGSSMTTGIVNTLIGQNSGSSITTAINNTTIGASCGSNITTGGYNTMIGSQSGNNITGTSGNTCIGYNANVGTGLSTSTAIGYNASCTASNTIQLGRSTDNVNCPNTLSVTGIITATGGISGTSTNAINVVNSGLTANTNYPLAYLSSNTAGANVTVSSDTGGNHLLFNPTLNQLSIAGNVNINGSASNLTIGSTGTAISCPSASAISFPSANVTATTFTGALSGNSSTATTAGTCTGNSATATTATTAGTCTGNSATATNISSGSAGNLLYQSGASVTAKLPIGPSTYVLTSSGSIPQWTAPITPTLANVLLSGSSAGSTNLFMNGQYITGCQELDVVDIVSTNLINAFNITSSDIAEFNSCIIDTTFGTSGLATLNSCQVDTTLTTIGDAIFNAGAIIGNNIPLFNSTSTSNPLVIQSGVGQGITLKTGGAAGISTTLGSTGILTLAQPPAMSGASITANTIPIASVVGTAVALSGSQTIAGSKTFSSTILATGGVTGISSLATSLVGGLGGSIPYQNAVNATYLLANGTVGQVLTSAGTTLAPTWTTPSSFTNASTITLANTASGATNYLVMSTTNTGVSSLLTDNSGATYDSTTNIATINVSGNSATATTATTAGTCSGNSATATTATNQSGGTVNATTGAFSSAATFNSSIILQTTAPTNTAGYLGYTVKQLGNYASTYVNGGGPYTMNSTGVSLTAGTYIIQFYLQVNTTVTIATVQLLQIALSTTAGSFSGGFNGVYICGAMTTTAVATQVGGNYTTVFTVPTTATYYFLMSPNFSTGTLSPNNNTFVQYTRIA